MGLWKLMEQLIKFRESDDEDSFTDLAIEADSSSE
jgi:hypothetical protein